MRRNSGLVGGGAAGACAVTRDEIAEKVWQRRIALDASIYSRIRPARQAIGDDSLHRTTIRTIMAEASVLWLMQRKPPPRKTQEHPLPQRCGSALTGRPSITILRFLPLAMASDPAILADAIPSEVIQSLSRPRWLAVIARWSSFLFRKHDPDLALEATTLGAGHLLSGISEATGRGPAVTLEHSATSTTRMIWRDRIVAPFESNDDLRGRIVTHLSTAPEGYIPLNEARTAQMVPIWAVRA